jgi:hypothetical protein
LGVAKRMCCSASRIFLDGGSRHVKREIKTGKPEKRTGHFQKGQTEAATQRAPTV